MTKNSMICKHSLKRLSRFSWTGTSSSRHLETWKTANKSRRTSSIRSRQSSTTWISWTVMLDFSSPTQQNSNSSALKASAHNLSRLARTSLERRENSGNWVAVLRTTQILMWLRNSVNCCRIRSFWRRATHLASSCITLNGAQRTFTFMM
jgi:hypothetical protein